mmetsp:Transcript_18675/g.60379  ORF Transcript_18675/g.60379 Transcript_18675/m.60379 type:complete len:100 (+) Transcript_18675:683-982(+)
MPHRLKRPSPRQWPSLWASCRKNDGGPIAFATRFDCARAKDTSSSGITIIIATIFSQSKMPVSESLPPQRRCRRTPSPAERSQRLKKPPSTRALSFYRQ